MSKNLVSFLALWFITTSSLLLSAGVFALLFFLGVGSPWIGFAVAAVFGLWLNAVVCFFGRRLWGRA